MEIKKIYENLYVELIENENTLPCNALKELRTS
jgi:hypothetical protein